MSRAFFKIAILAGICVFAAAVPSGARAQQGTFVPTGNMNASRGFASATLLSDGKVLIAGGSDDTGAPLISAEIYDPATGQFTVTGNMTVARSGHSATLLGNGKVLIAGGVGPFLMNSGGGSQTYVPGTAAELYDPTTGTFAQTGVMVYARTYHTATLLSNGQVLLIGGQDCIGDHCPGHSTAEIYDTTNGTFAFSGYVEDHSPWAQAVLLKNDIVVLFGGTVQGFPEYDELYDPATGTDTLIGYDPRSTPSATMLNNGVVLIAGGDSGIGSVEGVASAELYDPVANKYAATGNLTSYQGEQTATLLENGMVLLAGGLGATSTGVTTGPASTAELYDPTTGTFSATGSLLAARVNATATLLKNGTVLVTGGFSSLGSPSVPLASAELFENNAVGPGPIVSLSPVTVSFGTQILGVASALQTVTLTNTGKSSLSIQGLSLVGANAGDFLIDNSSSCKSGTTVAANASCTIAVAFLPTAVGARNASVSITSNGAFGLSTLPLSGTGAPVAGLTVAPSNISFPAQYVGTSGNPQSVTVTNTGTIALNISSVTASPSDFGVLNACGSTVAVGASCAIGVFFDPTVGGSRTGTLTITDNGTGGTQTVALSGSGQDFSMVAGTGSATVSAGQTANYMVSVAPAGGFAQSVSLSCSGAPGGAACTVTPSMVTVGASGANVAVAVTTTARSTVMPFEVGNRQMRMMLLMASGALFLLLLVMRRRIGQELAGYRWASVAALGLPACAAMTLTACGGGNASSGGGGGALGTQAGNYTITVTGSFSGGSANLSHATKLTLVVQ